MKTKFAVTTASSMGLVLTFAAMASASLTQVGPTLSENSTEAKAQVQTLLKHDRGVQSFLGLSTSVSAKIEVTEAQAIVCKIGTTLCPFNTGKQGWKLKTTSFRWGHKRPAYRVTFKSGSKTFRVTVHKLSSNMLSKLTLKKVKKPKRVKVTRKQITMRLVAVANASAVNSDGADVTCPAGYSARAKASASAGSSSAASAQVKSVKVKANRGAWQQFMKTAQVFADAIAVADASTSIECIPNVTPPTPPAEKPGKDGQPGAGTGNGGGNGNDEPGAGDSGTAPAADCWAIDGNGDPTIPGYWDPILKECKRK